MIFCCLDYWTISNTLHNLVKTTEIIPTIKTDHAAISLELVNRSNDIKGPSFWKMNCSLLDDKDYVNDINWHPFHEPPTAVEVFLEPYTSTRLSTITVYLFSAI